MVPPDSTSALVEKRADSSVNWLPLRAAGPTQPKAAATWQTASLVRRPWVRPLMSSGNPAASATEIWASVGHTPPLRVTLTTR
jgi:hypothetical protein